MQFPSLYLVYILLSIWGLGISFTSTSQTPPSTGNIVGYVFLDSNQDSIRNEDESGIPEFSVLLNGEFAAHTNRDGRYEIFLDTAGTYELSVTSPHYLPTDYSVGTLESTTITVEELSPAVSTLSFGVIIAIGNLELDAHLHAQGLSPGESLSLQCYTEGRFPYSADSLIFELYYDSQVLNYVESSISTLAVTDGVLQWTQSVSTPFPEWLETHHFDTSEGLDGQLNFELYAFIFSNGIATSEYLIYSVEPDDQNASVSKTVVPQGYGPQGEIPIDTESLTYRLSFENNGSEPVNELLIIDGIDINSFDLTEIEVLAKSHLEGQLVFINQELHWYFDSLDLTTHVSNSQESYVFIEFNLPIKENLAENHVIINRAEVVTVPSDTLTSQSTINTLHACNTADISATEIYCTGEQLDAQNSQSTLGSIWTLTDIGSFAQAAAPDITWEQEGQYWLGLEVTDLVCNSLSQDSVLLTIYETPSAPVIIQSGNALSTLNGWPLQWYLDGEEIPEATDGILIIEEDGVYTVASINGPCVNFSDTYSAIYSGLPNLFDTGEIRITQSEGAIHIRWTDKTSIDQLYIYDNQGKKVFAARTAGLSEESIPTSNLTYGSYVVQYLTSEGTMGTHTMFKK